MKLEPEQAHKLAQYLVQDLPRLQEIKHLQTVMPILLPDLPFVNASNEFDGCLGASHAGPVNCRQRLGGILNYYYREAA